MTSGTRYRIALLLTGAGLALLPWQAKANGLIGSQVTGSLLFGSSPTNFFDPANGYVPASGYLNSSGTTVTIASPQVEFGFQDLVNTDIAQFSATQFTIEDVVPPTAGGSDNAFTMTFVDTSFANELPVLVQATDSFPHGGLTGSLVGDEIIIHWAGGPVNANDDYTSTFTFAEVPEPSTWNMFGLGGGILALAFVWRRNRQPAAP